MRSFAKIIQTLVSSVIDIRQNLSCRSAVTSQFIGYYDTRGTELANKSLEKPLRGLRITTRLHQNIKYFAVRVDGTPQPIFNSIDRDNDFIKMPLISRFWSIPTDAIGKRCSKSIDPETDRFAANSDPAFSQEIFYICGA